MKMGRLLWKIIIIKLFIMFVVVKNFFYVDTGFTKQSEREKADQFIDNMTKGVSQD